MKSLNSVGKCLNSLASNDLVSNESVVPLTTTLERTWRYFDIFEKTLQDDEDLKAATVAQEIILPESETIKAKKEKLADLGSQIVKLQSQRYVIESEFEKDFEANKPWLAAYAVGAKWIQILKADKKAQQAKITMG